MTSTPVPRDPTMPLRPPPDIITPVAGTLDVTSPVYDVHGRRTDPPTVTRDLAQRDTPSSGTLVRQRTRYRVAVPAGDRVAVFVWQAPVRIIHWLLISSIVVLSVTGIYIGNPKVIPGGTGFLLMAYVRAVHIGVGFVFLALLIARIIFAFSGNEYARWPIFVPFRKEHRQKIIPALRFYTFRSHEPPAVIGHNPLAGATYLVLFLMFMVQVLTGFALDSVEARGGWMWDLTGWVYQIAPIGMVRLVHHVVMWLTWGFAVHHVYSAVLMDHIERSGVVSSMISGWKNIPWDHK